MNILLAKLIKIEDKRYKYTILRLKEEKGPSHRCSEIIKIKNGYNEVYKNKLKLRWNGSFLEKHKLPKITSNRKCACLITTNQVKSVV